MVHEHLDRFIAELNEDCSTPEYQSKASVDQLREVGWTDAELWQLNIHLVDQSFEAVAEAFDDQARELPPMVIAAFEWLVGTFEITHRDYTPLWFRGA
jgi:hypothetical protein